MDLIKTLRKKKADVNNLEVYTTVYGWCFVKVITDDRIYLSIPQDHDDEYHGGFMVNSEGKVIKDGDNNTHVHSMYPLQYRNIQFVIYSKRLFTFL